MLSYRFNFFNLSYLDILKSPVATEVTIEVCDGVKCSRDIPHCEHVSPLTSAASPDFSPPLRKPASMWPLCCSHLCSDKVQSYCY